MKRLYLLAILTIFALPLFGMSNSGENIFASHNKVRAALDVMVNAYNNKNISEFMEQVSENYTGEKKIFDSRIRTGFSRMHDLDLRYSINNITNDSDGRFVYVAVNFTKSYTEIKTTKRLTKTGTSQLIFEIKKERALLHSVRGINMFGSN